MQLQGALHFSAHNSYDCNIIFSRDFTDYTPHALGSAISMLLIALPSSPRFMIIDMFASEAAVETIMDVYVVLPRHQDFGVTSGCSNHSCTINI